MGKTKLSKKLIAHFCTLFKLNQREIKYFELLVNYGHAKTQDEKRYYFDCIMDFKEIRKKILTPDQFVFYSKWYYSAIHCLLLNYTFEGDFVKLAAMLSPAITPSQAEDAVSLLLRIELIKKNEKGIYERLYIHISPGEFSGTASSPLIPHITGYLDRAKESMITEPLGARMAKGYMIWASQETYEALTEEIKEFYRKLYKKAAIYRQNDINKRKKAYHLSTQLFPITKDITFEN